MAKGEKSGKGSKRSSQHGKPKETPPSSATRGRGKVPKERWDSYFEERSETNRPPDQRIPHSLNHPLRLDIMTILSERISSPNEIKAELAVPLSSASYHITQLLKANQIECVGTRQRRGAVEHYYRAIVKPEVSDEEWLKLSKPVRHQIAAVGLNFLVSESLAALGHGKMDTDDDLAIVCSSMRLNKVSREKLSSILAECQGRIEQLREEEDPDEPVRFVGLLQFERSRSGTPLNP